ncbi:MAG: aminopeptidase P family protein [Alphaproteobacteria bacterium]|nr:aminopeptidase P family protein [Alphaproteobacteria bacterium]
MDNKHKELRSLLVQRNIDFYLVPSQDEYLGEYTTDHTNRLKFITGFTGSNGLAIFSAKGEDLFYTDARYLIQAGKELSKNFKVLDMAAVPIRNTLKDICKSDANIGIDARMHTVTQIESFKKFVPENQIVCIEENLIDLIWDKRPKREISDIFIHPIKYSGEKTLSKIGRICFLMKEDLVDYFIVSDPHSICWLLNIRGHDLNYTPLILSSAILHKDGRVDLYCANKADKTVLHYFKENNIHMHVEDQFSSDIGVLEGKVSISSKASYFIKSKLNAPIIVQDYCDMPKACKNKTEIQGAVDAHIEDAKAVSKMIKWVYESLDSGKKITELDVSDKILEFRKEGMGFVCPSFPTIAGFKENGAIIHYAPSKKSSKDISGTGLLLIDSGGQYYGGTTDITRTIAIGDPTKEQMNDFTLVLKGFIAVASAKFKFGTTGADLDVLARKFLEEERKNYPHGTGHGVGSFLSVHEGPQSITKHSSVALKPGMIVSIEPGFYKEGEYGIRIENLAFIKESNERGKLEFQMLTLVPIQEKLIDFGMLTDEEKEWLQNYNELCNKENLC